MKRGIIAEQNIFIIKHKTPETYGFLLKMSYLRKNAGTISVLIVVLFVFGCDLKEGDDLLNIITGPGGDSDAILSGLTVSPGNLTPPFDQIVSNYSVLVDSTVTTIKVTPTGRAANQTILIFASTIENNEGGIPISSGQTSDSIPLVLEGDTRIILRVTSRNGETVLNYIIDVSCECNLSKISFP